MLVKKFHYYNIIPYFFVLLFFSSCNGFSSCNIDSQNIGKIKIAVERDIYLRDTVAAPETDFSCELLETICSLHQLPISIEYFEDINKAMMKLDRRYYNIIVADIPITSTINKNYQTTKPVYADYSVLIQNSKASGGNLVNTHQCLANQTITIPYIVPLIERIKNLSSEIGDTIYINILNGISEKEIVNKVSHGELQFTVASKRHADKYTKIYPDIDASLPISFNQFRSLILHPRDTILRDSLDKWIDDFRKTDNYIFMAEKHKINYYYGERD